MGGKALKKKSRLWLLSSIGSTVWPQEKPLYFLCCSLPVCTMQIKN